MTVYVCVVQDYNIHSLNPPVMNLPIVKFCTTFLPFPPANFTRMHAHIHLSTPSPFSSWHILPSSRATVSRQPSPADNASSQNFFSRGMVSDRSVPSSRKDISSTRVSSAATRTLHSSSLVSSMRLGRMEDLVRSSLGGGERGKKE